MKKILFVSLLPLIMIIAFTSITYSQNGDEAEVSGVTILTPNGGEAIPSGLIYTINWDLVSDAVNFSLFYSLNNGIKWNLIESNLTGTSYNWAVLIPKNNKKKCIIKVIGYNISGMKVGEDTSDGTFTIEVVKVISPNGGEVLDDFNIYTITWLLNETINPVEKSYLYYTDDGGATWKLIAIRPPEPTSYPWRTPMLSTAKTRCKVKVVLKDAAGKNVGIDVSNKFFTIEP